MTKDTLTVAHKFSTTWDSSAQPRAATVHIVLFDLPGYCSQRFLFTGEQFCLFSAVTHQAFNAQLDLSQQLIAVIEFGSSVADVGANGLVSFAKLLQFDFQGLNLAH